MNRVDNKGFTLIELMLAMSFISILLLAIAMTIIQVGSLYNKGLTIKELNQVSRDIGADVQKGVASATFVDFDKDYQSNQDGGRLCLGSVSYIWNTAKALQEGVATVTRYQDDADKTIQLLRVPDSGKVYCATNPLDGSLAQQTIRTEDVPYAQELLETGERKLGINKFVLSLSASDEGSAQSLYTLDYTIGTGDIAAMNADQSACKNAGEVGADLAYCNVQTFTLVLRAGNGVN